MLNLESGRVGNFITADFSIPRVEGNNWKPKSLRELIFRANARKILSELLSSSPPSGGVLEANQWWERRNVSFVPLLGEVHTHLPFGKGDYFPRINRGNEETVIINGKATSLAILADFAAVEGIALHERMFNNGEEVTADSPRDWNIYVKLIK